jgi:hypothetical protein
VKPSFVLLLLCLCAIGFGISFEAEELSFNLRPGYWEMDGLFHFANYAAEEVSKTIYFPIPEDSLSLHPELLMLEVLDDSLASCRLLSQGAGGFSFALVMPARHFCTMRIAYRQELRGNKAKYIISTANSWGKPLTFASYVLNVANGISITKTPFPPQQSCGGEFEWMFENFSPVSEFELEFSYN